MTAADESDGAVTAAPSRSPPGFPVADAPRFDSIDAVRDGPRRRRLPGRRRHRRGRLPGRPAGQAGPGRRAGRHRQDRAGQVGRPPDRQPAHPPPVLRGPRRVQGPLRVELQEAAAADPGRRGQLVAAARGGHLLRGVPPHPSAARGHPVARAGGAAGRRGRPGRARDRGAAARDPLRVPGVDPRARHGAGHPDPAGLPHLQQHPRALRGAEAPLPLPAHAPGRDHLPAAARRHLAGRRVAALRVDPVRRLLRGLPGRDQHPRGAGAPARQGGRRQARKEFFRRTGGVLALRTGAPLTPAARRGPARRLPSAASWWPGPAGSGGCRRR